MSVDFEEVEGSPKEQWSSSGLKVTRKLMVDWDDKNAFTAELIGDANPYGGAPFSNYPGYTGVFIVSFDVEPVTDDVVHDPPTDHETDLARYTSKALFTVRYESLSATLDGVNQQDMPQVEEGTVLIYRQDHSVDAELYSGSDVLAESLATQPKQEDFEFVQLIPVVHHSLSWQRVPNPPFSAVRMLKGTVNSSAFLGAGKGLLLFEGASIERQWIFRTDLGPIGQAWRVDMAFSERAVQTGETDTNGHPVVRGWNYKYVSLPADQAGWTKITLKDGSTPYQYADFTPLFQQESRPNWLPDQGDDQEVAEEEEEA